METVMIVMLALSIGGSIVGLIGYYAFKWIDTCNLNYETKKAKIIEKIFKSAYKETFLQPIALRRTMVIPMQNQISERYYFELEVQGKRGRLKVTKNSYIKFKEGQEASVKCAVTRLTKKLLFK